MPGTIVNPTTISGYDGATNPNNLFGKAGEDVVAELHGKYYTQSYRGTMFWATQVSTTAPAIYTATAVTSFGLWNPTGSGKNCVLAKVIYVPTVAGATVVNSLGLAVTQNTGAALGTAAPLSATTPITATRGNSLLNGQGALTSIATCVSAATLTSAPSLFVPLGLCYPTNAITAMTGSTWIFDCDGLLIVQPGTFVSISSNAAETGTGVGGMYWYEAPL